MRQYFGDETYYDSFEKLEWINKVSEGQSAYLSFSPSNLTVTKRHFSDMLILSKKYMKYKVSFQSVFGENRKVPYVSKSIIGRSAMSDGAISPEGTRAFARGAYNGHFPINTGEGGLTSNFLATLNLKDCDNDYLESKKGT